MFHGCLLLLIGLVYAQAGPIDYLRAIEDQVIEVRVAAHGCKPLFFLLVRKLYELSERLFGYDEVVVNRQYDIVQSFFFKLKQQTTSPNAQACIDSNMQVVRFTTRNFKYASTCLLISLEELGSTLKVLFRIFVPENQFPTYECPLPVFCGLTRPSLNSLLVSFNALVSLGKNSIKLLYQLLTFSSKLQSCRTNMSVFGGVLKSLVHNGRMCTMIS